MAKRNNKRWVSYLLLGINTLCWGAALIVVKPAFDVTSPFRFLLYRYVIAVFLSIPFLIYYWPKIKNKAKTIGLIFSLEMIGTTLALTLLYLGLAKTTAIEASFLTTTTPIFVIAAGVLLLKEKQEGYEWLGTLLAFAGTGLLTLLPLWQVAVNGYQLSLTGNLLIIGQNIATALYVVLAKKRYRKLPKLFVTTISFYLGLVSFALFSWMEQGFSLPNLTQAILADFQHQSVWIASGYMALFGSIIGLTTYIKGQDNIEASEASLFWYLQPLVYLPLGVLWLHEVISWTQAIAMVIILIGVVIAEKRWRSQPRR